MHRGFQPWLKLNFEVTFLQNHGHLQRSAKWTALVRNYGCESAIDSG